MVFLARISSTFPDTASKKTRPGWPSPNRTRTKMERGKFARQLVQSISVVGGRGLNTSNCGRKYAPNATSVLSRREKKRKAMYEFFKPVSFLSPPLLHIAIFIISNQKSYRASREYLNSLRLFDCLLVFNIRNFFFFFI